MTEQALEGVKVVEFTKMISASYCGKLLADMGAEVVKIEKPETGDMVRQREPYCGDRPHSEKSILHLFLNTNKKSITLNVSRSEGLTLLGRLSQWADILISDYQPNELEQIGIDYQQLLKSNPKLVITAITPFGLTGPKRNDKGCNLTIAHAGGHAFLLPRFSRSPSRPPVKPGGNVTSFDNGLGAKIATLAALFYQQRTGKGQIVDVSEQEIQIDMQRVETVTSANGGVYQTRFRQAHLAGVGGNVPCKDGVVNVAAMMDSQWQALKETLNDAEFSDNPKAKDLTTVYQHDKEIRATVDRLTARQNKWDLTMRGQKRKLPITPVLEAEEVVNSEQLNFRGFFTSISHPQVGEISKFPGATYKMSVTPWKVTRPAPELGEHNQKILSNHLAMRDEEVAALKREKIV